MSKYKLHMWTLGAYAYNPSQAKYTRSHPVQKDREKCWKSVR
jgi:hypothetical protein